MKMRIPTNKEYDRLADLTGGANDKMHWKDMFSWVDDVGAEHCVPTDCRTIRGGVSARYWNGYNAASRSVLVGFRPAVEALGSGALVSDVHDGESVVVGTLYMGDKPVVVPQHPTWNGDITAYVPGAKLEMREALDDPAYQVFGIRVGDTFIADRVLLRDISYEDIEKILSATNKEGFCDDFASITLTKSEWANILNGLELAIDDRLEMSGAAYDEEDAEDCAKSANELTRLHDVISNCIAK